MKSVQNLTGSLLVAHPSLRDPNFRRTIVFISHHEESEGATGFILNRPLQESLNSVPSLPAVPVYLGGPVETSRLLLASLQWRSNPDAVAFRTFPGRLAEISVEGDWQNGLRAYAGYAGWSAGQLEEEIDGESWLVVPPTRALIEMHDPAGSWKSTLHAAGPMFRLMAEAPDEPWRN